MSRSRAQSVLSVVLGSATLLLSACTGIFAAASKGNVQRVEELISDGTNPNETLVSREAPKHWGLFDPEFYGRGETPLMVAALYGQADVVQRLLELGADPSLSTTAGLTALHYASFLRPCYSLTASERSFAATVRFFDITRTCVSGKLRSIALLLKSGANLNATSLAGDTPLAVAARPDPITPKWTFLNSGNRLPGETWETVDWGTIYSSVTLLVDDFRFHKVLLLSLMESGAEAESMRLGSMRTSPTIGSFLKDQGAASGASVVRALRDSLCKGDRCKAEPLVMAASRPPPPSENEKAVQRDTAIAGGPKPADTCIVSSCTKAAREYAFYNMFCKLLTQQGPAFQGLGIPSDACQRKTTSETLVREQFDCSDNQKLKLEPREYFQIQIPRNSLEFETYYRQTLDPKGDPLCKGK